MMAAPAIVHATPGRVRIHLSGWTGHDRQSVDQALRRQPGVRGVRLNPLTGNALVFFDPAVTDAEAVQRGMGTIGDLFVSLPEEALPEAMPHLGHRVLHERRPGTGLARARIAVPGIERNPHFARQVVAHLARQPGVQRVVANPLTGRVLVEFAAHKVDLDDLVAQIVDMDLPDLIEEDDPAHPLDPAPLLQSASRTAGAAIGLGLVGVSRAMGSEAIFAAAEPAAKVAGIIGVLRGFPVIRNGLRHLFGRNLVDFAFSLPNIIALALSDNPLGLAVTGLEAIRLLTEVMARRRAFRRYEAQLGDVLNLAQPGALVRVEAGERVPLDGEVLDGHGTAIGCDGMPVALAPGARIPAGARVFGGPLTVRFSEPVGFDRQQRPAPPRATLYDRYVGVVAPASLLYAIASGILARSATRTLEALLLLNPRAAIIGMEAANLGASAYALRAGVTVVGTRPERVIRRPDVLLIAGARPLTDGFEIASTVPLVEGVEVAAIVSSAAAIAAAAGAPWGGALRGIVREPATEGSFDGRVARARIGDHWYTLGPSQEDQPQLSDKQAPHAGQLMLELTRDHGQQLGIFCLRPRLASGAMDLVAACQRLGVMPVVCAEDDSPSMRDVARRLKIEAVMGQAPAIIQAYQRAGNIVAAVADSANAGAAFEAADLGIGLVEARQPFLARTELLAPDLPTIQAILEAGAQRDATVRDSVGCSFIANILGIAVGFRDGPGILRASRFVYGAALAALADGWLRLRGGERPGISLAALTDPRPERWGDQDIGAIARVLQSSPTGLSLAEAQRRRIASHPAKPRYALLEAVRMQAQSPLTLLLAGAAGVSLALGSLANAALIGVTLLGNLLIAVWQERQVNQVAAALQVRSTTTAHVLRDGAVCALPAPEVVPGDVLVLESGDRVPADARIISAEYLEVDEAALTGESLPVRKGPDAPTPAARIVLHGSDVATGTGRAIAFAVGHQTRMGATELALQSAAPCRNPLDERLSMLLRRSIPAALAGGALVAATSALRGGAVAGSLVYGATIALSALPEGLPSLASIGAVGVARRLMGQGALVRRLTAVEALGRVDVACTDKTGTLTQGRIALTTVADLRREGSPAPDLAGDLRAILVSAALASPHPDLPGFRPHPTDIAVIQGAERAGLGRAIRRAREAEAPFDPLRGYHAVILDHMLHVKGAPEVLAARCGFTQRAGERVRLDDAGRQALLDRAAALSGRGLRVLLVASADAADHIEPLADLTALGFVGLSDPLRPSVRAAVRTCQAAGIRLVMLTGDHPATARAIAYEAGLPVSADGVVTGEELASMQNGELDARLERVAIIARASPLDKLRIIESLQRHRHIVAMTGDGVNDAPALRLADIGVAMGRGGTDVARQTADVVLLDDEFSTLVEALVEGRSYWRNIRRALGLLVGGNAGELGLVVAAGLLGLAAPFSVRQVLGVNFITDVLPGLAVSVQQPQHRRLHHLAREGATSLDRLLQRDILRRASTTAAASLGAFGAMLLRGDLAQASAVAYGSIIATQLAQTLEAGGTAEGLNWPLVGAVLGSAGLLVASYAVPPVRAFLGLARPTPFALGSIALATLGSTAASRLWAIISEGDGNAQALAAPVLATGQP